MNPIFIIAKIEHTGKHPRLGAGQTIPANLVLRWGFTPADSWTINATNEEKKGAESFINPPGKSLRDQDFYYNSVTGQLQEEAP